MPSLRKYNPLPWCRATLRKAKRTKLLRRSSPPPTMSNTSPDYDLDLAPHPLDDPLHLALADRRPRTPLSTDFHPSAQGVFSAPPSPPPSASSAGEERAHVDAVAQPVHASQVRVVVARVPGSGPAVGVPARPLRRVGATWYFHG